MLEIFISLIAIIVIVLCLWYPRYLKKKYYNNLKEEVPKELKKLIAKYNKNQKISLNKNKYKIKGRYTSLNQINFPPFKYILLLWIILILICLFLLNWNLLIVLIAFIIIPLIFYLWFRYYGTYITDLVIKNNRLIIYQDKEVLEEFKLEDISLKIKVTKELDAKRSYKIYLNYDKTYKLIADHEICNQSYLIAFIYLIHLVNTKQLDTKTIEVRTVLKEIEKFNLFDKLNL